MDAMELSTFCTLLLRPVLNGMDRAWVMRSKSKRGLACIIAREASKRLQQMAGSWQTSPQVARKLIQNFAEVSGPVQLLTAGA